MIRKVIFMMAMAPLCLVGQNITNTLGTNGVFTVEDANSNNLITAKPFFSTPKIIIGDWESGYNMPDIGTSTFDFSRLNGSARLNIVVAKGTAINAIPKLNFYYTPGSFTSPLDVGTTAGTSILGIIEFGGYLNGTWQEGNASITGDVAGTNGNIMATKLTFSTKNISGGSQAMILNSDGNLTVHGAVTSQAIKTIASGDLTVGIYAASINDGTLLSTVGAVISLPTVTAGENGKTITIKNVSGANSITVFGNIYDADETGPSANEIVLDADGEYVTLQYNHSTTTWYAISRNY